VNPTRRAVLKACVAAGVCGRVRVAASASQDDPLSLRPQAGDRLVRAGDDARAPLGADAITRGAAPTVAWPMDAEGRVRSGSRFNQLLLLRFDADALAPDTLARAADGVVAYSGICTHSGCDVDDWQPGEQIMSCSCHLSAFDPRDGAKVVDGPAPRPLPALPLAIVDGRLSVAKPFTARVGFQGGF